ncbi:PLP-dependent aminotransferase family protein [Paracoccus sp. 11-3]|uniref:PLP-dependent aminotransferase family protein n=1 Tax=Paracoccus amoyensis TaxID=2760093 RepID=A0A926GA77_9RHOB|nr:PLP-dependent aminotransferase family protein [Paracoccus amoyensis]MBC9247293.1 PLP-dependent aminotransferase family protein [Paracoccus amoyensis]
MPGARYLKFAEMISNAIRDGTFPPGSRLPTHRAFAEKFGLALATATRVYQELERKGLVLGEAGRGTFVRDPNVPPTAGLRQDETPDMIDLMFNMPGNAVDADMLRAGLRKLAAGGDLEALLRYHPHGGRAHERKIFADHHSQMVAPARPENLLVTSGGQHGLSIVCSALLRRGDAVAVDALTYPGFKSVAELHGLDLVPIQPVAGVMDPDDLERQSRSRRLRAVYLMPTVHSPLGTVMDERTRQRIADVGRRHDLMLIEDGAYAFLETGAPPSFQHIAPERTIYIASFSKSLATGLRLGYVVAPDGCIDNLTGAIRATIWNAPAVISGLVTGWIEDGTLAESMERRRRDGAARRRLCREVFGDDIMAHPNAAFAWLPLIPGLRAEPIIAKLRKGGISISGAEAFATTMAVPQALRLAFGGIELETLPRIFRQIHEITAAAKISGRISSPSGGA